MNAVFRIDTDKRGWSQLGEEPSIERTPQEQEQRSKEGAQSYKQLHNILPVPGREKEEMILDTNEYWQIGIQTVLARGGRFMPFKETDYNKITTYNELANVLYKFQSYYQFIAKRNAERDQ